MTDEQIEKELYAMYVRESSGYQTSLEYGGKADENQEKFLDLLGGTLDYINRLKSENERLKQSDISKENCTIEQHAEIQKLRDELKQVRKDTAREILQDIKYGIENTKYYKFNPMLVYELETIVSHISQKYGVEVE